MAEGVEGWTGGLLAAWRKGCSGCSGCSVVNAKGPTKAAQIPIVFHFLKFSFTPLFDAFGSLFGSCIFSRRSARLSVFNSFNAPIYKMHLMLPSTYTHTYMCQCICYVLYERNTL